MSTEALTQAFLVGRDQYLIDTLAYRGILDQATASFRLQIAQVGSQTWVDWLTVDATGAVSMAAVGIPASAITSGTLDPARMPALTGDVTSPVGSVLTTLATVNANVGTFGDASNVAQITVNAKGLITAVATVAISGGGGGITAVSVATTNGFAGSSSGGVTPALTLSTTITGVLKGNGTALVAATVGTDYSGGTGSLATGLLKSTTTTGALSIAVAATDFVAPSAYASANGLTLATARLLGRTTAGSGAAEEIAIAGTLTLSGGVLTGTGGTGTVTGTGTSTKLAKWTAGSAIGDSLLTETTAGAGTLATGAAVTFTGSAASPGQAFAALTVSGNFAAPTGVAAGFVRIAPTLNPTAANKGSVGLFVDAVASDTGGGANQGLRVSLTDTTATVNQLFGMGIYVQADPAAGSGAKTITGIRMDIGDGQTVAHDIVGIDMLVDPSGATTTGTRNTYGVKSFVQPQTSNGGTDNAYAIWAKAGGVVTTGTVNNYGVYVANGSPTTAGTSLNIGLYVEAMTGADTNYAAIFAGGNVGIGTVTPAAVLSINGGCHVGGDSDPGDNNLAVDGTLAVTGVSTFTGVATFTALPVFTTALTTLGTITTGVWNAGAITSSGDIITSASHAIYSQKVGTVTKIGSVGTELPFACGASKTFTFTSSVQNGMVFIVVYEGTGTAALCVASFAPAAIQTLGDASIVNTATPGAAQIGVSKSANSSVISVKAGSGLAGNMSIMLLGGYATSVTDPV